MKLRTIGAVLAGAAMIGATVAGAAAAATVPAKSWWIDPATGAPNVTIVVGAQANASDVVSASLIAAAVGNMATVEETASVPVTASATFDKVYQFDYSGDWGSKKNMWDNGCANSAYYDNFYLWNNESFTVDLVDIAPVNDANLRNVALVMPAEVRTGGVLGARALNTLWFSNSPKDWDSKDRVYKFSITSASGSKVTYQLMNNMWQDTATDEWQVTYPNAGGSYDNGNGQFDFKWDKGFYTTTAWVDIGNSTCDYNFGGTGTAMEAHEEIQVIVYDKKTDGSFNGIADLAGDKGHASGIVYRTAEIRYPLLENGQNICGVTKCDGMIDFETARKGYLNEIKFLGKMYKPMFAGATNYVDGYLGAYFMYGSPFAEKEKIMKVGDVYTFHGWTVTLNDVNIYENKAYITVAGPALSAPFTFIMVMDAIGVEACSPCCPTCATYGGGGAFTSNPTMRTEYDPYLVKTTVSKTKDGYDYTFFSYVNFMLDGIKTFVGADGTYLAEFNLYAIEDYGYLENKGCCDPFVTTPNDYGLAIYGGWLDAYNVSETAYGIAGAYHLWEPAAACSACPDANFDTLELQLCDTITIPDCETSYTVNGPENYFTIEFADVKFDKGTYDETGTLYALDNDSTYGTASAPAATDSDGVKLTIKQTTAGQTIKYTANVKIDPVELIKLDIEVNTATNTKNLVLVGGPVYNSIVKDLVDMGASTVDWATSAGEWEWIADPMAKGYDVLIVAGANREETRMAAEDLVAMLN
jgi:hypothetical protein